MAPRQQPKTLEGRPVTLAPDGATMLCSCRVLDVHSQGDSPAAARANLSEAVQLFLDSCGELGSRDQLLRAAGFLSVAPGIVPPACCRSTCCPCHVEEG